MSAIAIVLAEMGHQVSGSDLREQTSLDRVRAAGVDVHVGHDPALVEGCDAVTVSTAIPASNVEWREAQRLGIPVLRRAGMLAAICARARSLGVAGTHGKTTTTSMLMLVLAEAGMAPSFIVGGDVHDAGTGGQWSGSEWLVVEADESDATHVELPLGGHDGAQRGDRLPRPLRHVRSARRQLRPVPGAGRRPEGAVRRRPDLPPAGGASRRDDLWPRRRRRRSRRRGSFERWLVPLRRRAAPTPTAATPGWET